MADTGASVNGNRPEPPAAMNGGGGLESMLEKAVADKVITQSTADKIKEFLQEWEESRKADFEKMQSLSEEERKAYIEQQKQENNLFGELVQEGILTQSQADAISKMIPSKDDRKPENANQPQNTNQSKNTANTTQIKVMINGSQKTFSPAPVNKNGNVLVPMRSFFEALGCEVKWDETSKTATGIKNGTQVNLTINKTNAYVNNQTKSLSSAAQIINGSTFIPLRFVGEALGADVSWENGTITITQK